jgi:pimeloyl-ACP methyl ester carboxylesterase
VKWFWRILGGLALVLLAAFFVLRVPDTDAGAMYAKYGTPPSQMLGIDGTRRVHVRDEGPRDAPVVILLHGSNADLHTWQAWADALKSDYRVIRFDQRGHGLTGPAADGDYALDAFVKDIDAVADALNVERFTLAGNSMGGAIDTVDRYWELARYPGNRNATRQRFATPRRNFDAAQIAAVTVPTLVMWGEEDSLIPYEAAGWYMEHLPNATLANYPGIGHIPMEEAPEQSVADLRIWLGEVLASQDVADEGTAS